MKLPENLLKINGGEGVFTRVLSTSNLYQPKIESVKQYLKLCNCTDKKGDLVREFEKRFAEYHNSKFCVAFSSGFWALVLAIKQKSIKGRDNVIMPSLTYRRLADVVHWAGKTPVFVDVNQGDLAISVEAIKKNIDTQTALILAVHPIVNCCEVDKIIQLSLETGIPLVVDAVESVHETYNKKRVGSFGCGEVFSLHASKLINGLEGGYVCTDDESFANELELMRNSFVCNKESDLVAGIDSYPVEGHLSFALSCLDEIEVNVSHNFEIYKTYQKYLKSITGLRLLKFNENEQTSFKNIVIEVLDGFPIGGEGLVNLLNDEGLLARLHYDPPLHKKEYAYDVIIKDMANTEKNSKRFVNLPCGARASVDDVIKICRIIEYFVSNSSCLKYTIT